MIVEINYLGGYMHLMIVMIAVSILFVIEIQNGNYGKIMTVSKQLLWL